MKKLLFLISLVALSLLVLAFCDGMITKNNAALFITLGIALVNALFGLIIGLFMLFQQPKNEQEDHYDPDNHLGI